MKVKILFFGATAEATGKREVEIDFYDDTTAEKCFAELLEKFPLLKNHKLLFAVNQEYAEDSQIISDGDELAVFTAVSGG